MKHSLLITLLLLSMFFITQIFGLFVIKAYIPETKQIVDTSGNITNVTVYNLPYGTAPPEGTTPRTSLISILVAITIAIIIMILLMQLNAEVFLRLWFFVVVTLALGITFFAFLQNKPYASIIALLIALPLAFIKIFKRNIIVHNLTELAIYPGIAAIFVPLLNIWTMSILLVVISLYDMYAVWHSGFMQRMARYQIKTLRVFSGFFIPYLGAKERRLLARQHSKSKKIKISIAILGGGDIVFPLILAGIVLQQFSLFSSLFVVVGATLALAALFYMSEKGKFYPAMPFISLGCFLALGAIALFR